MIRSEKPSSKDFLSQKALGRRLFSEKFRDLYDGVSTYDTAERARVRALQVPRMGTHIAEFLVPHGARVEKSLDKGHYTVWADPEELLAGVVRIGASTAKVRTVFEVLDTSSGNVVGAYRTVDEAVHAIEQFAQKHGPSELDDLALLEVDDRGEKASAVATGRIEMSALIQYLNSAAADSVATHSRSR